MRGSRAAAPKETKSCRTQGDFGSMRAALRPEMANLKPVMAKVKPPRADLRPEKPDLRLERDDGSLRGLI